MSKVAVTARVYAKIESTLPIGLLLYFALLVRENAIIIKKPATTKAKVMAMLYSLEKGTTCVSSRPSMRNAMRNHTHPAVTAYLDLFISLFTPLKLTAGSKSPRSIPDSGGGPSS